MEFVVAILCLQKREKVNKILIPVKMDQLLGIYTYRCTSRWDHLRCGPSCRRVRASDQPTRYFPKEPSNIPPPKFLRFCPPDSARRNPAMLSVLYYTGYPAPVDLNSRGNLLWGICLAPRLTAAKQSPPPVSFAILKLHRSPEHQQI